MGIDAIYRDFNNIKQLCIYLKCKFTIYLAGNDFEVFDLN